MPRNGSGTYNPPAGDLPVSNTLALASKMNNVISDIADALTTSVATDGQSTMTGNLKMGGFRITGASAGSASSTTFSPVGEINTGIYFPAAGQVAIACAGTQQLLVSSSGLSGNGSGLTNLNASNIATGTLPDGRLSSNVAMRNASNTFSGDVSVTGVISGNGSGLTSINASNISSGTLADARLSTNVALRNVNNNFTVPQSIDGGTNGGLTISASETAQIRWYNTGAPANNRYWIAFTGTDGTWGLYSYLDGPVSGTATIVFTRFNNVPGVIKTFASFLAGDLQNNIGRVGLFIGSSTRSGYIAFFDLNNNRQGYIGYSSTTGGTDTGTIEYIAGLHSFTGALRTATIGVPFSSVSTFSARQSNVFYFGTLTGNVTSMTITDPTDGQTIRIRFVQDGVGGRTVALPAGTQVSGSLDTAPNSVTWLVMTYVAGAPRWEGMWMRTS